MKNIKRILSFLLLTVYMLTSLSIGTFAADETAESILAPAIAAGEYKGEHEDAVDMLIRLGIINNGLMINENVTRGGFTGVAMQLMGIVPFTPSETKFIDVTAENPNSGAINAAADMGIISGVGEGKFDPEGTITVAQAAKILLSIMGYDVYALNKGGFPTGYLTVGAQQGLLDDVEENGDCLCTWETASQLIYNALYIDILHKEVANEKYYTNKGETVMTEYMGILKYNGIVIADEFTSIVGTEQAKAGYVRIGTELFLENGSGISEAMGVDVDVYYEEIGSKKSIVTYKESGESRIIEIDAYDISPDTTKAKIIYFPDNGNKTKEITTNSNTAVIYNGRFMPYDSLTDSMLNIEIGKLKVIFKTGSTADVLFIENTEVYVVGSISYGSGTVVDAFDDSKRITIDENDGDIKIDIVHDGDKIQLKDIKRKFVLAVTASNDGKIIKIVACNDKLKGTVKEIGEDFLVIDEYKYNYIKSNQTEFDKLKVGDKVTFYFTADEKLAGYGSISADNEKYGYLLDAGATGSGINAGNDGLFRIFTTDGKWNTYKNAKKISLNGSSTDGSGNKYTAASIIRDIGNSNFIQTNEPTHEIYFFQLIKFSVNNEGEITEIYTAEDNRYPQNGGTANGTGMYTENFSLDYRTRNKAAVVARESSYKEFGVLAGRYSIGGTVGIMMPSRSLLISFAEGYTDRSVIEKSFSVFSPVSTWVNDQDNQGLFVELYDTNEDFVPQILLSYADAKNDNASSGGGAVTIEATEFEHFTVDQYVSGLDDNEVPAKKLYGYYQNKYQSFVVDETAPAFVQNPELLKLRKGDVIRIKLSPTKSITNILKVFTLHPELDAGYDNSVIAQTKGGEYPTNADGVWSGNWTFVDTRVNDYLLNGNYYNEFRGESSSAPTLIPTWRFDNKVGWNVINRLIHAKAYRVANGQLIVDLGTSHPDGYRRNGTYNDAQPTWIDGGVKVPYSILTLSSVKPQITVYDEARDEVRAGTIDDIDPYNPAQSLVIRNRYFVPYEIHIVNRKSAPENEIYWVGNYLY